MITGLDSEILGLLNGGTKDWYDLHDGKVRAATLYLVQGCADWDRCFFCGLPDAVRFFNVAYLGGRSMSAEEHRNNFLANLERLDRGVHTLMVFNAGSFLAPGVNPPEVRDFIILSAASHPSIKRLVVEARAPLITAANLKAFKPLLDSGKELTVRIGVETFDDDLRNKKLVKGFTRRQIMEAVDALRHMGASAGGYALLNPVPGLEPEFAVEEASRTLDWMLGDAGFAEAYFGPTCVPAAFEGMPERPIYSSWISGKFRPASLWATWKVLKNAAEHHPQKVHLLPFSDQPPFVAVPSNHVPRGIPESLSGAQGCDLAFHQMFERYRETNDVRSLVPPECACKPEKM